MVTTKTPKPQPAESLATGNEFIDLGTLAQGARLPVLPAGTTRLLTRLANENLLHDELAAMLEEYPTITARLLSVANSPWSSPSVPVDSLEVACARLGFETVRAITIAITVSAPFNPLRCPEFDARRYWCSALLVADGAGLVARIAHATEAIEVPAARSAGLLHNLGLLWLADCLPLETGLALRAVAEDETGTLSVNQALRNICGAGHNEAGVALAKAWNLPATVRAAMNYHNPLNAGPKMLGLTRVVASAAGMVSQLYRQDPVPAHPAFGGLDLDVEELNRVYEILRANFTVRQRLAETLIPTRV